MDDGAVFWMDVHQMLLDEEGDSTNKEMPPLEPLEGTWG